MKKKILADFAWFAELYREDIIRRTKTGIARARAEGKRIGGRKPKYSLENFEILYKELKAKGYNHTEIMKKMGLSRATFYGYLKKIG